MASSGYFENVFKTGYALRLEWQINSQSVANNTSNITVNLYLVSKGSSYYINSSSSKPVSLTINGTTYESEISNGSLSANQKRRIMTKTVNIAHNADGTKTINLRGYINLYAKLGDTWYYHIYTPKSGAASVALDAIPRQATILSAPNFSDEDNPTITYSNPAGSAVESLKACIANEDGTYTYADYRDIPMDGSSYTFNLTDDEREKLRWGTINSNTLTVKFYVTTVVGGVTYYSTLDKVLTIVNANPSISATVYDSNSVTTALTGDSNIFVKYYSNAEYSITATAKKGASIKSYSATVGNITNDNASGVLEKVEDAIFRFSVTDSRGNLVGQITTRTLIDYVKLTCNFTVTAPTTDGESTIKISGNYFNGSFGATNNTLTVQYRYRANSGDYTEWITSTATLKENTYAATIEVTGLNYKNAYTFQTRVIDKLGEKQSVTKTVRTTPVFDWGENDFNFNVPVSIQHNPIADFIVEQGEQDGWFYRKWNGGIAECWKLYYGSGINASATNYNGFYYSPTVSVPFPFTFINLPCVQVNGGSTSNMNFVRVFGQYSDGASFTVCGHTDSATNVDITVNIYAIGKWK